MSRRRALLPLVLVGLLGVGIAGAPDSAAEGAFPDVRLVSHRADGGYPDGDTVLDSVTPNGTVALLATNATDMPRPTGDRGGTVTALADLDSGSLNAYPINGDERARFFSGDGTKVLGSRIDGTYFLRDWRTGADQSFTLPDRARISNLSDDGTRVLYLADRSAAPGRTSPQDAWLLDLRTGEATIVGIGSDGSLPEDGVSTADISGDASTLVFTTDNIHYADGWSQAVPNIAIRRDLRTGVSTELQSGIALGVGVVSRNGATVVIREASGEVFNTVHTRSASFAAGSSVPAVSVDGRYVAYIAPIRPQRPALWRLDTSLGARQLASLSSATMPDEHAVLSGTMSADGTTVAYEIGNAQAADLGGNHPRGVHVYVRRMSSAQEVRVCCPPPGGLAPQLVNMALGGNGNRLVFTTKVRYDEVRNPGYALNVYAWTRPG